jgi:serine protease AprX
VFAGSVVQRTPGAAATGRLPKAASALVVAVLALVWTGAARAAATTIDPILLADAKSSPAKMERIIILSEKSVAGARDAFAKVKANTDGYGTGVLRKDLPLVGGVAADLPAARMGALAKLPGLTVGLDDQLKSDAFDDFSNVQLWPYLSGFAHLWTYQWNPAPPTPTIAIVDTGVNAGVPDMAGRLLIPQVNLCSLSPNSAGDGRGHGTFVASILAGIAKNHVGAAPNGKIISIDVMNDKGVATTSDVIAAAQWIVDHRNQYYIKVANFSLHSTSPSHFVNDPLDKAVEKLWLSGVVVVTAAGNYGVGGASTQVRYAPGNDPFVITVGALDNKGTLDRGDDNAAPWSTWGYTLDGFAKPEIAASGRYMIGAVPSTATMLAERPGNAWGTGYMQLSGTSFSAPVVAGAAAQLLALHPELSPDQVKGALMLGSDPAGAVTAGSVGVGELNVSKSASLLGGTLPNPNAALNAFLAYNWDVSTIPYFDGDKWTKTIAANPNWDAASWEAKFWNSASQEAKFWNSMAWETKFWNSASTLDASWAAQSRTDTSTEAKAEGDKNSTAYPLTAIDRSALLGDPYLAPAP